MELAAIAFVFLSLVVVGGMGGAVLYMMIRSMVNYPDPDLTPGEEMTFRAAAAISFDKMLGFANGQVFVTNQRAIWTPRTFPKPLGASAVSIPLHLVNSVNVGSREVYRWFAVPVHVTVPGHVYNFYVGINPFARGNAQRFAALLQSQLRSSDNTAEPTPPPFDAPFTRHRNWDYAAIPLSVLASAALFLVDLKLHILTPLMVVILIGGPILTTGVVVLQEVRERRG